jgi:hypothetical protein
LILLTDRDWTTVDSLKWKGAIGSWGRCRVVWCRVVWCWAPQFLVHGCRDRFEFMLYEFGLTQSAKQKGEPLTGRGRDYVSSRHASTCHSHQETLLICLCIWSPTFSVPFVVRKITWFMV